MTEDEWRGLTWSGEEWNGVNRVYFMARGALVEIGLRKVYEDGKVNGK